ncbi:MAG: pyrimidine dimer DNA glycosylase/endonuclease V [Gallionella sp.]
MRLWSLHPRYLDARGLVALWREGLLAQKVLAGMTRGYRHHPQLSRFREHADAPGAIAAYLNAVLREAERRGYRFNAAKIACGATGVRIPVTHGQLDYEMEHLQAKLKLRDQAALQRIQSVQEPDPHPLFVVVAGDIESWEVLR